MKYALFVFLLFVCNVNYSTTTNIVWDIKAINKSLKTKPKVLVEIKRAYKKVNYKQLDSIKIKYSPLIEMLKRDEGLRLKPYICPGGYLTIGYGHVLNNGSEMDIYIIEANYNISPELAELILLSDIQRNEKAVLELLDYTIRNSENSEIIYNLSEIMFNDSKLMALTSFSISLGIGSLSKSTLFKQNICLGLPIDTEIVKWSNINGVHSPFILKRRKQELLWYKSSSFCLLSF